MKPIARSSARRAAAGFTLIELLVAMAILAVVAVLAWRGLDEVARARDHLTQSMESERSMTQFFNQVRSDARRIASDDLVGSPPLLLERDGFRMVRRFDVPGQATHLQVVRYQVIDHRIVRFASPPLRTVGDLRRALAADAGEAQDWSRVSLIAGITAMQARAFVPNVGWTANAADLGQALQRSLAVPTLPQSAEAPPVRSVTGLEVRLTRAPLQVPFIHSYVLGE